MAGTRYALRKVQTKMSYEAGTLLSCGHDGCGCRVRIEVPCHCSGDHAYVCKCGDDMVEIAG